MALENENIVLTDTGFNVADGIPSNLKLCPHGTRNERRLVETVLSLVTMVSRLKKVLHCTRHYFQARLAYVVALFNSIFGLNRRLESDADPQDEPFHFAL